MATPRNSNFTVYTAVQSAGETETINSQSVTGILADGNGDLFISTGTALVTDGSSGYSKGGLFSLINATAGSACLYCNEGSRTSSKFTLVTQA